MKKTQNRKLKLSRQTLRKLTDTQASLVAGGGLSVGGGGGGTIWDSCDCPPPPSDGCTSNTLTATKMSCPTSGGVRCGSVPRPY